LKQGKVKLGLKLGDRTAGRETEGAKYGIKEKLPHLALRGGTGVQRAKCGYLLNQ